MPHTKNLKWFTLVELIVTITIIAILWTIAFTAFNGFQSSARDSSRASDLANLSQALDTYYIKTGSYPNPDNSFTVTYSGWSLWYQWTVWDTLINILSSNGSKLSKKPTDPLTTTREYTYSKSAYGNTYELSSNWEWDRIAYLSHLTSPKIGEELAHFFSLPLFQGESEGVTSSFITQAQAASGNPTITYIKGNYNGMVAKTVTGSVIYVIATPSLTTSTGTTGSSIDVTTLSGKLLYSWQTNSGWIAYTPTLIYSSWSLPINDTTGQITLLTTNLQTAYSGSVISQNSNISNVLTTTGPTNITSLWASIITNYLGWSASAPPPPAPPSYSLSNSLMFDSASAQYLSRTPSVAGSLTTWTMSLWYKQSRVGVNEMLWSAGTSGVTYAEYKAVDNKLRIRAGTIEYETTQVFRDPSAWQHLVFVWNTTNGTDGNRFRLYVNGQEINSWSSETHAALNEQSEWNKAQIHSIGRYQYNGTEYFDGYLADVNFVDSGALDPTSFWYTDTTTNQWLPKAYTGTYGTNGFHLDFSSGALTAGSNVGLGKDSSGNGNYWNTNWITDPVYNQVIDTPLNNFATLNPLWSEALTLWKWNLKWVGTTDWHEAPSTIWVLSGKWYWEQTYVAWSYGYAGIFVWRSDARLWSGGWLGQDPLGYSYYSNWYKQATASTIYTTYWSGWVNWDVIWVALDLETIPSQIIFYRNWVSQWVAFSWFTNGNPIFPAISTYIWTTLIANFWQWWQSGLTNFPSAGGYFKYQPPSGFKALSTANLPDPTIKNPKQYFDVLMYTGNSTLNRTVTGLGFQPDFVWIKNRTAAIDNVFFDSVRTAWKQLESPTLNAESDQWIYWLTSFNSNWFTLWTNGSVNSANTYVAWNWKKWNGLTGPGFDIVSYTGNGSNQNINHSLWKAPSMMIVKNRDSITNWAVYFYELWNNKALKLNTADSFVSADWWNYTFPSSTNFTVWASQSDPDKKHIAYLWSEVPGFSKFWSYTGNGSSDGPFVYTGFRPRYVMIKRSDSTGDWIVQDTARATNNPSDTNLYPSLSAIETIGGGYPIDITANGFKIRNSATYMNAASPATYIYAAFAEAPFKYANAR